MTIYKDILNAVKAQEKLFAVLIDPDKTKITEIANFIERINQSKATHVFVGGSVVAEAATEILVIEIKKHTALPVVLFPGDITQISDRADGILFLSLISGRNSDYLIDKQVKAVSKLVNTNLEILPTGYILIENGIETAVQKVSQTQPISRRHIQLIIDTAIAGEYLGMKLIYLEAGSGATYPISAEIISKVKERISVPLIVGGGISSMYQLEEAYNSGADLVVVGTAFEQNESFFDELKCNESVILNEVEKF
ncbi:MAG: geranylgeranylglyceryl/heptaprenylglyceryl phosphate synthase [Flavobacteriaceae bacterium]|nr:geranylgeranylglyceryl/heptaprenylglyceryl phosphate synthase [Flavobacteriaceae bacterium]